MCVKSPIVDVGRSDFLVFDPAASSVAEALAFPVLSMKDQETLCGEFCYCGFGVWVSWPTISTERLKSWQQGRRSEVG